MTATRDPTCLRRRAVDSFFRTRALIRSSSYPVGAAASCRRRSPTSFRSAGSWAESRISLMKPYTNEQPISLSGIIPAMLRQNDFEAFFNRHAEPLFRFLLYRTGDRAWTEDLVGDTFERALKARNRFDPGKGDEKTWLYTIALNCHRDQSRRRAVEQEALSEAAVVASSRQGHDAMEQVEVRDTVGRALSVLPPDELEAIALRYGADLTVPQIARLIREPLTTAEGRLYRALRHLRDELSQVDHESPHGEVR